MVATCSKVRVVGTLARNSLDTMVPASAEPMFTAGAVPVFTTCSSICTASGTMAMLARRVKSTRRLMSVRSAGL